jgi:hypothetical protein
MGKSKSHSMKKTVFCLMLILVISSVTSCTWYVRHSDPFYNYNENDFPREHLPIINPIEATRERSFEPWYLGLGNDIWIQIPNSNNAYYAYSRVEKLQKFAVENGIVMAYSSYTDMQTDAYIQNNFYHWFVMIPSKDIAVGFHTEDEFDQYIQTLGIQNLDWQTPDEAFDKFVDTGCLEWIPDCNQQ